MSASNSEGSVCKRIRLLQRFERNFLRMGEASLRTNETEKICENIGDSRLGYPVKSLDVSISISVKFLFNNDFKNHVVLVYQKSHYVCTVVCNNKSCFKV